MKGFVSGLLGVCFIGIAGVAIFVASGLYNIGATVPHWGITERLIGIMRDRSIAAHSPDLRFPAAEYQEHVAAGLSHYDGMCRFCHGAPGRGPAEFAKGLFPSAPPLMSGHVQDRTDGELYWIIANGIKMTGMPAFGPTHEKDDLLGILALVRLLPGLGPERYADLLRTSSPNEGDGGHHHQGSGGQGGTKPEKAHGGGHHQ